MNLIESFRAACLRSISGFRAMGHMRKIDYFGDGVGTVRKNISFMNEPKFKTACDIAGQASVDVYEKGIIDVRWRQHIACFAARHALLLEGDFVECGVHTGLLSLAICHTLDFGKIDRTFYLCDTFQGIPIEQLEGSEKALAERHNKRYYLDSCERTRQNFSGFPNVRLIRGRLPETLDQVPSQRIAYLSIDLNQVNAERAVIEALWDRLASGAIVVIDDYAWVGHELQYSMWNEFADRHGKMIATLPTGQGLLIR
jgi:O-methyltransferase